MVLVGQRDPCDSLELLQARSTFLWHNGRGKVTFESIGGKDLMTEMLG